MERPDRTRTGLGQDREESSEVQDSAPGTERWAWSSQRACDAGGELAGKKAAVITPSKSPGVRQWSAVVGLCGTDDVFFFRHRTGETWDAGATWRRKFNYAVMLKPSVNQFERALKTRDLDQADLNWKL